MTILVQEMVYGVCKKNEEASETHNTASGTHLFVGLTRWEEESGVFSRIRDLFLCVGHIPLKLHNEGKAIHWLPRTSKNRKIGRLM